MPDLRQIRVLIEHRGALLRLCKLSFTARDASIYLIPYARNRSYYYGGRTLAENQFKDTFDSAGGVSVNSEPHLSIHESGQVRIRANSGAVAGPVIIPPIAELRGQHVASVVVDRIQGLKPFGRFPKNRGSEIDHVIPADAQVSSARLALYVNGLKASFAVDTCRLIFTIRRSTLARPLYLGIKPLAQEPISQPEHAGVTIIAGWDPTKSSQAEQDYLYIRGA